MNYYEFRCGVESPDVKMARYCKCLAVNANRKLRFCVQPNDLFIWRIENVWYHSTTFLISHRPLEHFSRASEDGIRHFACREEKNFNLPRDKINFSALTPRVEMVIVSRG